MEELEDVRAGRDLLAAEVKRLRDAIRQAIAVSTRSGDLAQIRLILREAIGVRS